MTSTPTSLRRRLIGLCRDLADVRDELQLQGARLLAAPTRAHVELDQTTLFMKCAVHGAGGLRDRSERRVAAIEPVNLRARERPRRPRSRSNRSRAPHRTTLLEHLTRRGCLRVPENAAVELHVLRVATDIGDEKERAAGGHGATLAGMGSPATVAAPKAGESPFPADILEGCPMRVATPSNPRGTPKPRTRASQSCPSGSIGASSRPWSATPRAGSRRSRSWSGSSATGTWVRARTSPGIRSIRSSSSAARVTSPGYAGGGRSTRSPRCLGWPTSSRSSRSARARANTAGGRSRAQRSTWPCARAASHSRTPSAGRQDP